MLGKRLERLRKLRGLTQTEVAKALHSTQQAIDNYEKDKREPKGATLRRLAQLYDVTVDYLLDPSDDPEATTSTTPTNEPSDQDVSALDRALKVLQGEENLSPEELEMLREYVLTGLKMLRANKGRAD